MSGLSNEGVCGVDNDPPLKNNDEAMAEVTEHAEKNEEHPMPSSQQEEEVIKKKYGGFLPKKKPLISKDHERAFFDSADWALNKQGAQKPKGPLEALRPKLQPTPHQQARSRRSAYAPADDEDIANTEDSNTDGLNVSSEDDDKDHNMVIEDQNHPNN